MCFMKHCLVVIYVEPGKFKILPMKMMDFLREEERDTFYEDDTVYKPVNFNPDVYYRFKLEDYDVDRWGDLGWRLVKMSFKLRWRRFKERFIKEGS